MKILSVDDNLSNLYLIEAMAKAHGHQVISAVNGRKALDALEKETFDLIISDILMPEMDGFQLCREVMRHPRFRKIPFIFYTATYTTKRDEAFGLSLGASKFLIKPVDPERFMQLIDQVMEENAPPLPARVPPVEDDSDYLTYLRIHNERLVDKLGKKILELEATQEHLQAQLAEKERQIARRTKAEEDLAQSARQLTRSNQDLTQFAYAAAHDLREPLRNVSHVLGLLHIDHAAQLDESARELIDLGRAGLKRMHQMVTDLLNFSKIADARPANCSPLNSGVVLNEVLKDLDSTIRATRAEISAEQLPYVAVERTHLAQILQNLIANSLTYAKSGQRPVIRISAVASGPLSCFSVEDQGIGFDPRYSEQIFGIFKRLHPSHQYEGTGIGLAICSRIVALYGGNIWAESEPNKGARFHFTLPRAESAAHHA
jgi:signal transduction histidine kinase